MKKKKRKRLTAGTVRFSPSSERSLRAIEDGPDGDHKKLLRMFRKAQREANRLWNMRRYKITGIIPAEFGMLDCNHIKGGVCYDCYKKYIGHAYEAGGKDERDKWANASLDVAARKAVLEDEEWVRHARLEFERDRSDRAEVLRYLVWAVPIIEGTGAYQMTLPRIKELLARVNPTGTP